MNAINSMKTAGADASHSQPSPLVTAKRRCIALGLDVKRPPEQGPLTRRSLNDRKRRYSRELEYAAAAFHRLRAPLAATGHVGIFADLEGNILFTTAAPEFLKTAEAVQLLAGANWNESYRGTNAIGTALAAKRAVRIHGSEHFFERHHTLTCAAAPLHSADGEVIGAIDISGSLERDLPGALDLATMAAEAIEHRLLIEETRKEQLVALRQVDCLMTTHGAALIAVDRDQRIVRANAGARRLLGADWRGRVFDPHCSAEPGLISESVGDSGGTTRIWSLSRDETRHAACESDRRGNVASTARPTHFQEIFARCERMQDTIDLARRAASSDFPVLMYGESGSGKERFAQSIHSGGDRREQPFVAVNCAALPDALIESELFGYEAGAFTGAAKGGAPGKFRAANGGTIFLDEIGDMSLRAQAALLRVAQEQAVTPVGGIETHSIDVRIIAATHRNLSAEIRAGRFREDLYYRLRGICISIPALRERGDVVQLAEYLLRGLGYGHLRLSSGARRQLLRHDWPGNVRELRSVLMQAAFLTDDGVIDSEHLIFEDASADCESRRTPAGLQTASLRDIERSAVSRALANHGGNIKRAAESLGIGRNTLYRKIREYAL